MKRVILMLSVIVAFSSSVNASNTAKSLCDDKESTQCKAYISGLVEGYIASKQNYIPKQPNFDSRYLDRAFASRVSQSYTSMDNKKPACLPLNVNKAEVIEHLTASKVDDNLTIQVGDYLRDKYRCESN